MFSHLNQNLDYLMKVIDDTNVKFGRGTVSVAAARINNNYKMKRSHSSKIDTSFLKFVPIVKTG